MPLVAAIGFPCANRSVASIRNVKLMLSDGGHGCCFALVAPELVHAGGRLGIAGVLDTCVGLNWKTTMFGSAPRSPAPKFRNAPFNAAMCSSSFLSPVFGSPTPSHQLKLHRIQP